MDYSENFCGIRYSAKRGETLEIRASAEDFNLNCWDGVLNLMSNDAIGRTALFAEDCDFYQGSKEWLIKVRPGTPIYMKELAKVRPVSDHEYQAHRLGRLW
jgi:hypothetical protein